MCRSEERMDLTGASLKALPYEGWGDIVRDIPPVAWATIGVALALGLSAIGAAW